MRDFLQFRVLGLLTVSICAVSVGACSTVVEGGGTKIIPDASSLNETPDSAPFVPADATPVLPPAPCVEGDRRVEGDDGTCYMLFFSAPLDWTSAQSACLGVSANLVSIVDLAEQTLVGGLAGMVPGNTPDIWMGANDQVTEASFLWVDATAFAYTNWRSGEPNNNGPGDTDEDCMLIEGDNGAREWDDRTCVAPLPYMCKRAPRSP